MLDRDAAKKHILETCGAGWLTLVDVLYDNRPDGVVITEVFQKWGGLKVSYDGESEHFEELADNVYKISEHLCEVCGNSGGYTIIDGWETTLCEAHYHASQAKQKYRRSDQKAE